MPLSEAGGFPSYRFARADDEPRPEGLGGMHRALRGRYRWALGIGSVLAVISVVAAWTLPHPGYRSIGLIDIAPKVPRIVYETEEKGLLPMYDNFMESQAALASSRRVSDMVMETPEWRKLGRGNTDEEIVKFQKSLAVSRMNRTEYIEVSFTDEDPDAAMVAVNQVIIAYMKLVDQHESDSDTTTLNQLNSTRDVINSQLNEMRASEAALTEDLGMEAFESRYQAAFAEFNKLESTLQQLDLEIATAKSAAEARTGTEASPITEQEMAASDKTMLDLLDEKSRREEAIAQLEADGFGPTHPRMEQAKKDLATTERRIATRAAAYRAGTTGKPETSVADVREKEARRVRVAEMRDKAQEETKRLGKAHIALANLEAEKVVLGERLDDVKRRLAQIRVESGVHGRITVASTGERPVRPESDKRIPLSVLGGLAGMGLGLGVVLLYGLAKARLRHVSDVVRENTWGRFLGVLPEVPDPEINLAAHDLATELSDHCMQHIRSMLQLRPSEDTRIVAITSPSAGAGKTTIGFALGLSFAAAGSRTLLIDSDFCGHGMTSAMRSIVVGGVGFSREATATVSDSSAPQGSPVASILAARRPRTDDAKAEDTIDDAAAKPATDAGEAPASTGTTLAALARRRLSDGNKSRSGTGILDALDGIPLERCVVETGIAGLSLLPVGDARGADVDRLTPSAYRRLMAECRERYDAVIIDTGPVLGSIEAAFATAAADDVVVVLPRGELRSVAEAALQRLRQVGVRIAGVVFNRALVQDVTHSNYSSKSVSVAAEAA
jgi:Mrp family chromosome partitioning ATPase/uncharacterized protein involved in exopolysaccharide biosynthesis